MKDNIQHKMSEFLLPEEIRDEIVKDISVFLIHYTSLVVGYLMFATDKPLPFGLGVYQW